MGMTASLKLKRIIENTRNAMAIEAMAAAQALDFVAPLKTSKRGQAAHAAIRSVSPTITEDRIFTPDFVCVAELIASGKLAEALRSLREIANDVPQAAVVIAQARANGAAAAPPYRRRRSAAKPG